MIRLLPLSLILISYVVEAGTPKIPEGVWQPSYAFLGKMAWDKNYLIVNSSNVIIEDSGVSSESYSYKEIEALEVPVIEISSTKIWVFDTNERFGCKPVSKLKYDPNCTQQNQRKGFAIFECRNMESAAQYREACSIIDSYYSFESRELIKLSEISENL
jgi:hypothetical protein